MKIAILTRSFLDLKPGGDTVQINIVVDTLISKGHHVDLFQYPQLPSDPHSYNVIHIFNVQNHKQSFRQAKWCIFLHIPYVLTPIYWSGIHYQNTNHVLRYHQNTLIRFCSILRLPIGPITSFKQIVLDRRRDNIIYVLRNSASILTNSIAELECLVNDFSLPQLRSKASTFPNIIKTQPSTQNHTYTENKPIEDLFAYSLSSSRPVVIQVGRVEPIKNQHLTILACKSIGLPLLIVGSQSNVIYAQYCKKIAIHHPVVFVEHVSLSYVQYLMSRSQIHCLPSFRESPGLATLEAAINGCSCVVSCHSPVQEYFNSNIYNICDPTSLSSLINALNNASLSTPNLNQELVKKYTCTERLYSSLINSYHLLNNN